MAAPRCSFTAAFVLLCAVAGVDAAASNDTCAYAEWALEDALMEDGLCAHVFASGLDKPRGIWPVHGSGCLLVLERGRGRIVALHDDDGDGRADATSVIATQPGVNHGLAVRSHLPVTHLFLVKLTPTPNNPESDVPPLTPPSTTPKATSPPLTPPPPSPTARDRSTAGTCTHPRTPLCGGGPTAPVSARHRRTTRRRSSSET